MKISFAAALCIGFYCTCAAADSPAAGTDLVLSLHSTDADELQLQYTRDVAGQEAQKVSVGLAKDYHYTNNEHGLQLYDYRLRRIYRVLPGNQFINDSLFAEVWFRVTELENRVRLRTRMQAAGLSMDKAPVSQDPFWMESDLGVMTPALPRPAMQREDLEGRTRWLLGSAEVAAVRYDAEPVPVALRGGLRRFWGSFAHLHPSIADDLAASNQIPQDLWIMTQRLGKDPAVTHWKLTARHWRTQARFPLPRHLPAVPTPTRSGSVYPEVFALLTREVANRTVPPAQEAYAARAQAAIDRSAGVEAMLALIEMNLALGHPMGACPVGDSRTFCVLAAKAGPLVNHDPRYLIAFARQAPDAADRPQFDSLPNGYLLRLLWATKPSGKDVSRENTERDLLAALKASAVADFAKDTGDFYAMGFEPFAAWQVWDFGRLMAGHVSDDLLHGIDALEDQLYIGVPSLF